MKRNNRTKKSMVAKTKDVKPAASVKAEHHPKEHAKSEHTKAENSKSDHSKAEHSKGNHSKPENVKAEIKNEPAVATGTKKASAQKQQKAAVAVAPVSVEQAKLSRLALIKARHEAMKREIDQIREDLESEEEE